MGRVNRLGNLTLASINRLSSVSGVLAAIVLFIMTLVVGYEVLMRYVFVRPTIWAFELSMFLLAITTFIGLTYTLKEEGHIRVDVLVQRLPERRRYLLHIITSVLSANTYRTYPLEAVGSCSSGGRAASCPHPHKTAYRTQNAKYKPQTVIFLTTI